MLQIKEKLKLWRCGVRESFRAALSDSNTNNRSILPKIGQERDSAVQLVGKNCIASGYIARLDGGNKQKLISLVGKRSRAREKLDGQVELQL